MVRTNTVMATARVTAAIMSTITVVLPIFAFLDPKRTSLAARKAVIIGLYKSNTTAAFNTDLAKLNGTSKGFKRPTTADVG